MNQNGTRYDHRFDSFPDPGRVPVKVQVKVLRNEAGDLWVEAAVPMRARLAYGTGGAVSSIPETVRVRIGQDGKGTAEVPQDYPHRYISQPKLRLFVSVQVEGRGEGVDVTGLTINASARQYSDPQSDSFKVFSFEAKLSELR